MKLFNFPLFTVTFSLISGIVLGEYLNFSEENCIYLLTFSTLTLWLFKRKSLRSDAFNYPFVATTVFTFIIIGFYIKKTNDPLHNKDHYTYKIDSNKKNERTLLNFTIKEKLAPTSYYNRYIIEINSINERPCTGKILLKIKKMSNQKVLYSTHQYISYDRLSELPRKLNPDQFDYQNFLNRRGIYHQITLKNNSIVSLGSRPHTIAQIRNSVLEKIQFSLKKSTLNEKQFAIINALILGQRQFMDKETYNDYKNAGAIHILALSGLHIGIIYLLISFLLSPFNYLLKKGLWIKTLFILFFLWNYAFLTGMSPSVVRAVTMFSFLAIGKLIRSKNSSYNSLLSSLFLILCVEPNFLFEIGFQLSYTAVFFIVWIQPELHKLYKPKTFIDKNIWDIITVSIAAQLGLLPLLLFYFHQFPTLFLLSNLIVLPILGFIIALGIMIILISLTLNEIPDFIILFYGRILDFINSIIHWISIQDRYIITEIPFNLFQLICLYILIFAFIYLAKTQSKLSFSIFTLTSLILFSSVFYLKIQSFKEEKLIIFASRNSSLMAYHKGSELHLYSEQALKPEEIDFLLGAYKISNLITDTFEKPLRNTYSYKGQNILILNNEILKNIKEISDVDILVLTGSPKIHLEEIIEKSHPSIIVADLNNYSNDIERWKITCKNSSIPFYNIAEQGAYILE